MTRRQALAVATLGGLGRVPAAPGTVGSIVGVAAAAVLAATLGTAGVAAAAVAALALGWAAAGPAARALGRRDPGEIIVDEVAGQLIALVGIQAGAVDLIGCFVLFRLFDIVKPPPVRQAERLPGGSGIMADDLVAGLCANLVWRVMRWLFELG